jgi:hypothetical protein
MGAELAPPKLIMDICLLRFFSIFFSLSFVPVEIQEFASSHHFHTLHRHQKITSVSPCEDYEPFMSVSLGSGGVDEGNSSMFRIVFFFFFSSSKQGRKKEDDWHLVW